MDLHELALAKALSGGSSGGGGGGGGGGGFTPTASQLRAMNSGATTEKIDQIATNTGDITTLDGRVSELESNEFTDAQLAAINSEITSESANMIPKNTSNIAINSSTLGYSHKNILVSTATDTTTKGISFTVNDDMSITANGTATGGNATYRINSAFHLEPGDYILSGCPEGGSGTGYRIQVSLLDYTYVNRDTGGSPVLHVTEPVDYIITIIIGNDTVVDNLTFYPMIRDAKITDNTYEPYKADVDTRLNEIETNPFVNATVLTAQEAEDFDYNALPTGSFVYILKDYSTPSVQSLSMTPMMSGLALPEDMGEEIEAVEDNTLNPLQTANNLRFVNTLTETSLDIEEGDSE